MDHQISLSLMQKARILLFEITCGEILEILSNNQISCLVLKGPHVQAILYDAKADRVFCDLDLLISSRQFYLTVQLLLQHGFQLFQINHKRLSSQKADYQIQLRSPQGVLVELHRALADESQFRSDVDGFFQRAEEFTFGELTCRGLGTEDLLLHLCLHLGKRHFMTCEKKHLQDIALLIEKRSVDWDAFLARASHARCRVVSYYSLMSAGLQQQANIPSRVLQKLKPNALRRKLVERYIDPSTFPLYRLAQNPNGMKDRFVNLLLLDTIPTMMRCMGSFSLRAIGDFILRWRPLRRLWLARHPLKGFLDMRDC